MSEPTLRGVPVLVTGARGFIGSRLVEILAEQGAQVNVLVRDNLRTERFRRLGCRVFIGDLSLPQTLPPAFVGRQIVFHNAVAFGALEDIWPINVEGTRQVVEMASQASAQRVVHVSSVAVHGENLPEMVREDQPYVTHGNSYEISKAEGEKLALQLGRERGVEVVVVRPTLAYGPGSPGWVLDWFKRVKYHKTALVDGGRGLANLVYVDDLVQGMILAALVPGVAGEAFFHSGPQPVTWREYLGEFSRMLGKPLPPSVPFWRARLGAAISRQTSRLTRRLPRLSAYHVNLMSQRTVFDISKGGRLLGYEPRVSLEKGMRRTETWLREKGYLPEK